MTSATFAYNFRTFCGGSKALSWLAAINIAVGLLYFLCRLVDALAGTGLCAAFGYLVLPSGFIPFMKHFWTAATYMGVHFDFFHLLFNTLWLIWFGRMFLDVASDRRLLLLYIGGGLAGALLYLVASAAAGNNGNFLVGSSAAVMSLMTATSIATPSRTVRLFLFGDVRLKWIAIVTIGLTLLTGGGNLPTLCAHLGGVIFGAAVQCHEKGMLRLPRRNQRRVSGKKLARHLRQRRRAEEPQPLSDGERLDQLLDKIRLSGYGSLSRKEKAELNAISRRLETKG